MRNILFVSSYPLPMYKGSNQHAYFFLKALAKHFNVYCLFFLQPGTNRNSGDENEILSLGIKAMDICHFNNNRTENKIIRLIMKILAFPNRYMNAATHSYGFKIINKVIRERSIDVIHFEHFHYTKYALKLRTHARKVAVYHDLHHLVPWRAVRFNQGFAAKCLLLLDSIKTYVFQIILDCHLDKKIFLNPVEMLRLPRNAEHIPHIVNPNIKFNPPRDTSFFQILFFGAFHHPPNRTSARYILDSVLPILSGQIDNFTIHFVGNGASSLAGRFPRSIQRFVSFQEFIPDINALFKGMDIALLPVLHGGGIKTKIIEAMAAGLPVVTTPHGIDGLENLPKGSVGIAESPSGLARELMQLIGDHSLRTRRSLAARSYVEKEHSFAVFSDKIKQVYSCI